MLRRSPLKQQSPRTIEERGQREKFNEGVLRRDRWQCRAFVLWREVPCRGRLDAHHVGPVSRFPELRYDVSNGVTLCRAHHDAVHGHPALAKARGLIR